MKKRALLFFSLLLAFAVQAIDFKVDKLKYTTNADGVTVSVARQEYALSGEIVVPASVTYKGKSFAVTAIGNEAFSKCFGINAMTIPSTVTSIGDEAFFGCGFSSIIIPESVTTIGNNAFFICNHLKSVRIPSGIDTIQDFTFNGCKALSSVILSPGVTTIAPYAFRGCDSLVSITFPMSLNTIGEGAFYGCKSLNKFEIAKDHPSFTVVDGVLFTKDMSVLVAYPAARKSANYIIPEGVTSIGEQSFVGCANLTSITIPSSVDSIEAGAFIGCGNLLTINIPDNVTSIGERAFQACASMTSIHISEGVRYIGMGAFIYCTSLTSVKIPMSVDSIGVGAFCFCSSLAHFEVDNNNPFYAVSDGILLSKNRSAIIAYPAAKKESHYLIPVGISSIDENAFAGCSTLNYVTIPLGVRSINKCAFLGCSGLDSISIAASVDSIGERAFWGCKSLTSVTIPEGVHKIGRSAFHSCVNLASVTIPGSVTSIGGQAFDNCKYLKEIHINASTPPVCDGDPFASISQTTCTLYVPAFSKDEYAASEYWKEFQIVEEDVQVMTIVWVLCVIALLLGTIFILSRRFKVGVLRSSPCKCGKMKDEESTNCINHKKDERYY